MALKVPLRALAPLILLLLLLVALLGQPANARKHELEVRGDVRRYIPITTFGFYRGGSLAVNVTRFHVLFDSYNASDAPDYTLGFSLYRTTNDGLNNYVDAFDKKCILKDQHYNSHSNSEAVLSFILDFESNRTRVACSENVGSGIQIFSNLDKMEAFKSLNAHDTLSDSAMFQSPKQAVAKVNGKEKAPDDAKKPVKRRAKRETDETSESSTRKRKSCDTAPIGLTLTPGKEQVRNTSFYILIDNEKEEGLYTLYFHNCHNYNSPFGKKVMASFNIAIEEKNRDSYLSAGEMPLPALYQLMSCLFFLSGCFWVFILRKNGTEQVYRIHWIMAALVYLKSLSLFFHGVNYSQIETQGHHLKSWAILYYVTHLLKGALLFFTIVLIGSGWAFIKHILSDKEKRVFMLVLPLQVIANVAYIIIEESEEGETRHSTSKNIFMLLDLLCCVAIILPVVWSIKHLQESSQTDGKAHISLEKLKLFRHFYIMVVCYIYFTRIIVYLLNITVPFQYEWLDEMFKEMATFVFFVMTGYKFRPASNNPYFNVPTDDYDMEEVLIGSTSINEQVTNRKKRVFVDDDDDSDDDEGMVFFPHSDEGSQKTELSHDLD